jgi:SSS family solute:Na+ symporter
MDASLFIGIMSALSVFYIILGWYASKGIEDHVDFFLAGKSLGIIATTATLLATQIGGGMFIGTAHDPFRGILYVLGIVISFLVLGLGIAEKFRELNIETVAGIFTKQYNSVVLTKVCAVLAIMTLCGILLSQTIAMHSVINNFTGSYTHYIFPLLWLVIIIYSLLGGLKAVIMVDLVQVAFVIFVFSLFFLYGIWIDDIPFFSVKILPQLQGSLSASNLPFGEAFRIVLISACYSVITQDVAHRFFAAKDKKTAKHSAFYSSLILFIFAIIPFYLGIKAFSLVGQGADKSPLFVSLAHIANGTPLVIAMCALMAAITSTVDSLLCAVSAVVCSLFTGFFKKAKNEVFLSQSIIVLCGVTIFVASYFVPQNIITTLIDSYEISVACLFVSIMAACIKKQKDLNLLSAYLSVGLGLTGFIFSKLNPIAWLHFWTLPIALGLSLFGYLIGDFLAQSKSKQA